MSGFSGIQKMFFRALPSTDEGLTLVKQTLTSVALFGGLGYVIRRYAPKLSVSNPGQYAIWYMSAIAVANFFMSLELKIFDGRYIEIIPATRSISAEEIEGKTEETDFAALVEEVDSEKAHFENEKAQAKFIWRLTTFTAERIQKMSDYQIEVLHSRLIDESERAALSVAGAESADTEEAPEAPITPAYLDSEARITLDNRRKKCLQKDALKIAFYALTYIPQIYLFYKVATALGCKDFSWETSPSNLNSTMLFLIANKIMRLNCFKG